MNRQQIIASTLEKKTDAAEARVVIENNAVAFKKGWPKASPQLKKRLIRNLLEKLIYTPSGLLTYYTTAKETAAEIHSDITKKAPEIVSGALSYLRRLSSDLTPGFLLAGGAPVVSIGGGGDYLTYQAMPCI